VLTMPGGWGRLFMSFSHTEADVDFALAAFGRAAGVLAAARAGAGDPAAGATSCPDPMR